jgi:DNA-directed RNA polymerase subunit L
MELEVKTSKKNLLEFNIKGERHTLPNLLRNKLLKENDVTFVSYTLRHPQDTEAEFVLRTNKKEAKKVLLEACKQITADLKDFETKIKKAMK